MTVDATSGWESDGSYVMNGQVFKADWVGFSRFPATFQDGTSQTILFTETYSAANSYNDENYRNAPNGGDRNMWWWDYAMFQSDSNGDYDCGFSFNRVGPNFPPLFQPPLQYCGDNWSPWAWGGSASVCLCRAVSPHTGGINVALADGSVKFVGQSISGNTWFAACTPQGGEILAGDWD
jgi:prepilin-type processing-associated H-X9-DG protein